MALPLEGCSLRVSRWLRRFRRLMKDKMMNIFIGTLPMNRFLFTLSHTKNLDAVERICFASRKYINYYT